MTTLASLVLYAADLDRTAAFYRTLGIDLRDAEHEGGPLHASADVGGVHIAVYAAEAGFAERPGRVPRWREAASSLPGFWVDSLVDTVAALRNDAAPVLVEHESREWGCRAVVEDPDGRSVELNQHDHCVHEG